MINPWEKYKLKDLTLKIGSGATPKGGEQSYSEKGISLIRSQNVLDFIFSPKGLAKINDDQANKLSNVKVEADDVLLNITGDSVARVCQVPNYLLPARVNQHVAIIRTKKSELDAKYLKYYLLNPIFKSQMLSIASYGGTRNALTKKMIEEFEIQLPPIQEQKSISCILSSLDNKIELNLQMKKTLEAIALAIFKEWYMDFRFLGFDGELMDGLPKGWKEGTLGDIIIYKNGKTSPERDDKGDYPVYGANGIIGYSDNYNAECNVTVIGRVGSFCGSTYFCQTRSWITDNAIVASPKTSSSMFTFIRLKSLNLNSFRGGSGQPLINQTVLSGIKTKIPDDSFLNLFEKTLLPIYKKIEFNEKQNLTLTLLRDTLLPGLMTGKIKVA